MSSQTGSVQGLRRKSSDTAPSNSGGMKPPPYPWKTRILLPGTILLAIGVLLVAAGYESFAPATAVRVAPVVQKSTTGPQPGSAVVQAAGWVEPDPFVIAVSALADGIVEDVPVLEGATVKKGEVIVRMVEDDARLELQQAEAMLATAEAERESAKAELLAAQTDWDNPVELDRAVAVTAAELDEMRALKNQVEAEITAEEAILVEAERAFNRAKQLFEVDEVGTEADLDKERARFQAQLAQVEAKKRQRVTTIAAIARLDAELQAASENRRLRTADKERLEEARAALSRAEAAVANAQAVRDEKALQLERMVVRAPMDGVVVRRLTQPGAKVIRMMDDPHSTHVLHLYDPQHLQVRVDVALADAALISVGQEAEITVEVLPDTVFQGEVTRVTHEANIQKNTLEVKVAITNPRPELRPEMLARVRFLATPVAAEDGERMAIFAPAAAVVQESGSAYAWVVDDRRGDRGRARRQLIETRGRGNAEWVEVTSGLQPGDRLVLNPPADLSDGARVRVTAEIADTPQEPNHGADRMPQPDPNVQPRQHDNHPS